MKKTSYKKILEAITEINPKALKADGFDAAIIGIGRVHGSPEVLVYDSDKCVDILMKRDNMTNEEAWEFFDYNVCNAYMGEGTPMFMISGI